MTYFTNQLVTVTTLTDSKENAEGIASAIITDQLAAATHILGPSLSQYWWEGELHAREEWIVEAITTHELADKVAETINQKHNYTLPSITLSHVVASGKLADWAYTVTRNPAPNNLAPACGALPCRETRRRIREYA